MNREQRDIELAEQYGAHNYHPLPIVISSAEGVWVQDSEGARYMDMLSAYSALNQGHRHPRIIEALKEQADKVTITSRAFHNEALGAFCEKLAAYTGKDRILPMNTGAEAVETAIKAVRRWAYSVKHIPDEQAEIIVFEGNFHGRTLTVTSFSSTEAYRQGFGPFTPGFRTCSLWRSGCIEGRDTAAYRCGADRADPRRSRHPYSAGRVSCGAAKLCEEHQVLLVADEIQTGFGRTGRRFACDWEDVIPDVYVMGKALGGGVMPVSAIAANRCHYGRIRTRVARLYVRRQPVELCRCNRCAGRYCGGEAGGPLVYAGAII